MAEFGNEFNVTKPVGSDEANTLDTIIEADTKVPLNDRLSLEHVPLNSGESTATDKVSPIAQGRHVPGLVGVLFTGTTAQIAAFTAAHVGIGKNGIGTGALALDTDESALYHWNGSAWTALGLTAAIYTAGDGILISSGEVSADYADEDDIVAGISTTKLVAVGDLEWAYGLTQHMEVRYETTDAVPTNMSTTPLCPYNKAVTEGIPGASLNTGTGIITLPIGVFELRFSGTFQDSTADDGGNSSRWVDVYDETNNKTLFRGPGFNSGSGYGFTQCAFQCTLSLTEETEISYRGHDAGTADTVWGSFNSYTNYPGEAVTHQMLNIYKKKLEGA